MLTYPIRARLIGGVMPRYIYFIESKWSRTFALDCVSFDRESETFTDVCDPVQELYDDKTPYFAYMCNYIDRVDNKVKILPLKKSVYNQIVDFSNKYGDPSHPDTGYDITITRNVTGLGKFDVFYVVTKGPNTKLKGNEKLIDLAKKYPALNYNESTG